MEQSQHKAKESNYKSPRLRSIDKMGNKEEALKAKEAWKASQKRKEEEVQELRREIAKNMEASGASGKPLKRGLNEPDSNIREYSVDPRKKEEDIEPPSYHDKKVLTESKATKGDLSGIKSKTEVKETKDMESKKEKKEVIEQKSPLIGSSKRSTRLSDAHKVEIVQVEEMKPSKKKENDRKSQEKEETAEEQQSKKRARPAGSSKEDNNQPEKLAEISEKKREVSRSKEKQKENANSKEKILVRGVDSRKNPAKVTEKSVHKKPDTSKDTGKARQKSALKGNADKKDSKFGVKKVKLDG